MAPDGFNGGSWQQPRNTSESEENTERTDPQLTRTVQKNTHWKWLQMVSTEAAGNSLGTPVNRRRTPREQIPN
ncbi:hypothetical protein F2Q68_00009372 [Brassica cretica]|uniref:Uncharacterized protein n=1 Tax=Brassica cretica TaxID=69181 RepID=A0A8S9L2Y0_BRACR|nr:hypothetical protein F2Q68_00009372 [Brassica cretica]